MILIRRVDDGLIVNAEHRPVSTPDYIYFSLTAHDELKTIFDSGFPPTIAYSEFPEASGSK